MRIHYLLVLGAAVGCGTSSSPGEPLLSGSATGSYESGSFTIESGVAAPHGSEFVILLSSQSVNCGSITSSDPPTGDNVVVSLPSLDVNSYSGVSVELIHNVGSFTGTGSNTGTVQITASTADSVAAMVSYSDTINSKAYSASGTFEVTRCPGS